jgi:glycosyltransferase involved in cell wall biosynthesis
MTDSAPVVSVVLPVHDEASNLAEALDSLFAQIYQDFEVVCVDDGSPTDCRGLATHQHPMTSGCG